jgi:polar amino acid transport system permease protein
MSLDVDLVVESIPKMLEGIGLTFQLLFLSLALGTALAILLLILRISGRWYLSWPTMIYIYIFRGTPILVQIFIIYYGFPQLEFIRDNDILWPIFREPFGCAIVALSLNTGAYVSEIFRGGVLGVDRGLKEAGAALGLSVTQRFIYITGPIAIRLCLPAYSNDVVSLMKSTALASTITLLDMMGIARTIVAETYAPYEIFVSVMVIYLVITWAIQRTFAWVEKRMSRHVRSEV